MHIFRARLETFTEQDLPDLDEVVLGALEFLSDASFPELTLTKYSRPLVVGSGNALHTGRFLFDGTDASFAEESEAAALIATKRYDALYIISASGAKHALMLAEKGVSSGLPTYLITANPSAPSRAIVGKDHTFVFPHIREPYTYNTSTYLSMLLGTTKESPKEISEFIEEKITPQIPLNLSETTAFIFILPAGYGPLRSMVETKFVELFGPYVEGRAYTREEIKHAKTVVTSPTQCIVQFGEQCEILSNGTQLVLALPEVYGPAALMAITYYVVGAIQKAHPPYFKENIGKYVKEASTLFGQHINVIQD
jgi:hypothetical protein